MLFIVNLLHIRHGFLLVRYQDIPYQIVLLYESHNPKLLHFAKHKRKDKDGIRGYKALCSLKMRFD